MVTETAPTLFPEIHEVAAPPGKGLHGYYRRRDGWIMTGPTTQTNKEDYAYKGYEFLAQYGQFKNVNDVKHEVDIRGVAWNSFTEPWRRIFQLGGVKEFPIAQIIAHRWHIQPPYREVEFPQLKGVTITDLFCPECENRVFSSVNAAEAAMHMRQHLTSKVNGQHDYRVEDLNALGKEEGIDFFSARVGQRRVRRGAEQPVTATEGLEMNEAQSFRCSACKQEFGRLVDVRIHKKECKAAPA